MQIVFNCSRLILQDPLKQFLILHLPCRHGKPDARDLGVGGAKLDTVSFKERENNVHSHSLVSVHKGVIGDQRKADASALFLLCRIKFLTVKRGKRRFERAIQERDITDIEQDTTIEMTDDEKIDFVAARILRLYRPAFEELAK